MLQVFSLLIRVILSPNQKYLYLFRIQKELPPAGDNSRYRH